MYENVELAASYFSVLTEDKIGKALKLIELVQKHKELEQYAQAHCLHPNTPSALEAIAIQLGMVSKDRIGSSIPEALGDVAGSLTEIAITLRGKRP